MAETQATTDPRQPEPGVEPDDLNVGSIVTIALISTLLLVASVLGVTTLVDRFDVSQDQAKNAEVTPKGLYFNGELVFRTPDDALNDQVQELNGYKAKDDGTFVIDIDRAKELVAADLWAEMQGPGMQDSGMQESGDPAADGAAEE